MADKNELKGAKKPQKDRGEKRRFRRVRETSSELKKVTWPTAVTVIKSTGVVLLVVAIFLVLLLAFDLILKVFAFNPLINGTLGDPTSAIKTAFSGLLESPRGIINTLTFGRLL